MLPLSVDTWGPEERDAAVSVIHSGQFTMGARVEAFERAYARYVGTKYCVACNSGSSANLLMVAAWTLRYGKGTAVVPAVGWSTSYSPLQQYGWKLRFVDIDRETLQFDMRRLADAADGADLIFAINLLGSCNDYDRFPEVPILEDNCESMGAQYRKRCAGSFGEMASHSTYFSHHICTMEGGMVTTNDRVFYEMLLSLRSHGWTRHLPRENHFGVTPEKFSFVLPGYNVRPTEIQAAIGLEQLKKLPGFVEQRQLNAEKFPWRKQREIGQSSWFGFCVYDEDVEKAKSLYEWRPVVTGNFLRQKAIQHYDYEVVGDLKNADYIHDHCIMVGNSHLPVVWAE